MADVPNDVASGIMARWAAAFATLDAATLSSLYARHALFFGSNPTLYRGRDGVAAYFAALPRWRTPAVRFTDVVTSQATPGVISVAATANFTFADDRAPLIVKLTWVLIREDDDWKIVSHHVSPTAALI